MHAAGGVGVIPGSSLTSVLASWTLAVAGILYAIWYGKLTLVDEPVTVGSLVLVLVAGSVPGVVRSLMLVAYDSLM